MPVFVRAVVAQAQRTNSVAEVAKRAALTASTLPALVAANPAFALVSKPCCDCRSDHCRQAADAGMMDGQKHRDWPALVHSACLEY